MELLEGFMGSFKEGDEFYDLWLERVEETREIKGEFKDWVSGYSICVYRSGQVVMEPEWKPEYHEKILKLSKELHGKQLN